MRLRSPGWRGSREERVCGAGSKAEESPPAQLQPGRGERRGSPPREGERGPTRRKGPAEQLPEEPLLKQRPGSVGAWGGEARMIGSLCQSTFSGGVAGEPFCTGLRKRLGYRQRQGDGRWRVWDAGTASALMGGLRMGRRGPQGGQTRGAVTGVEGLGRREEAGARVRRKREEDTVPPSGSSQPRGGTETKLSPPSSITDPQRD